ncbi:MAG: putative quorum-sensing-regulated virulence factor [Chlamydiales bacterium]
MGLIDQDTFVCFDLETTGLEPNTAQIIEVACVRFNFSTTFETFETLIDPECTIPQESIAIHNITPEMVKGQPKIHAVLPTLLKFIGKSIVVGHGIPLDLAFLTAAAKRHQIPCQLEAQAYIDTLRLARLYGESPINSLEKLREHFNIPAEGAHRAMSDVIINIAVFKYLTKQFKTTEQLLERLKHPILLKAMPLGKHKGRPFSELSLEYLQWAARKDFDQDLLFSIRTELKRRKQSTSFFQAGSPFASL